MVFSVSEWNKVVKGLKAVNYAQDKLIEEQAAINEKQAEQIKVLEKRVTELEKAEDQGIPVNKPEKKFKELEAKVDTPSLG